MESVIAILAQVTPRHHLIAFDIRHHDSTSRPHDKYDATHDKYDPIQDKYDSTHDKAWRHHVP